MKRGYHGTHHHMSAKHLDRYVAEIAGHHNRRPLDTEMMMQRTAAGMVERRLPYATLTAESAAETYPARTFTSAAPRVAPSVATSYYGFPEHAAAFPRGSNAEAVKQQLLERARNQGCEREVRRWMNW